MKEISSQENHINILLFCQAHDLVEASPAIFATNGISLFEADMVVGSHQDPNGIGSYAGVSNAAKPGL